MLKDLFKKKNKAESSYAMKFAPARAFQSRAERDGLLNDIANGRVFLRESRGQTEPAIYEKRKQTAAKLEALEDAYFNRLPLVTLAVCPFCGEEFRHSIDPYGYDGPWWDDQCFGRKVACKHFRVIRIATNLNGHRAKTFRITSEADFGPEVPYVIARLLKMRSMVCVISQLDLEIGYNFYPLVYFSRWKIDYAKLTSQWASDFFSSYESRQEDWDFNLKPWVKKRRVRWCRSENGILQLQPPKPDDFPFLDLEGHKGEQQAANDRYRKFSAPVEGSSKWDGG